MFWHPDLLWFGDSPPVGHPACRCSWCGLAIAAPDDCLRLAVHQRELRWHAACFAWQVTREGLLFEDLEALLRLWRLRHVA